MEVAMVVLNEMVAMVVAEADAVVVVVVVVVVDVVVMATVMSRGRRIWRSLTATMMTRAVDG